jgi:hypothetical protein
MVQQEADMLGIMTRSYFKLNRNNKKELEKKSEVALPF